MPHGNMALVISCMVVTCVIRSQKENTINLNTYSIHCLYDGIIMTSSLAINVLCNLFNVTTNHFSYKCLL